MKFVLWLLLILAISSGLRLYRLERQSLWFDEAYSVFMARNDPATLWKQQAADSSPTFYYSLLHYWIQLFGSSEFSVRLLSALFGILLIPLLFVAGRELFNRSVGLCAAIIAGISPIHIYYSQEARMYTLLSFMSLVSFLMLHLSLGKNRKRHWIGYVLSTTLCLYTHNFGVMLVLAQGIYCAVALYEKKDTAVSFRCFISAAGVLIAYVPRMLVLFGQMGGQMNQWIDPISTGELMSTLTHFALQSWRLPLTHAMSLLIAVASPVCGVLLLLGMGYRNSPWQRAFLVSYLIVPLAIAALISLRMPVFVAGRYDMLVFPAFCLCIAAGLYKVKWPLLRYGLYIFIGVATSLVLSRYYVHYEKSNDKVVAAYIQKSAADGDIIVTTELSMLPFEYYRTKERRFAVFPFPEGPRGYLVPEALTGDEAYIKMQTEKLMNTISPLLTQQNRIWVLYQPWRFSDKLLEWMTEHLTFVSKIDFSPGDNRNQVHAVVAFKQK